MSDHIVIRVPEADVGGVAATIADLVSDLNIPALYNVRAGDAAIGVAPVTLRQHKPTHQVVFDHRTLLATTEVAEGAGLARDVLEQYLRYGISLRRASEDFEQALGLAGGRISLHVPASRRADFETPAWDEVTGMMGEGLFYELGITLGSCMVQVDDSLADDRVRVAINDLRMPPHAMLARDELLVNDTVDRLALLGVKGRQAINPANDNECAIVSASDADKCKEAGLTTWDAAGHVVLEISARIRRHAGALLTTTSVELMCSMLASAFPHLVEKVRERYSIARLTKILRALLDEELSIRHGFNWLNWLLRMTPPVPVDFDKYILFPYPGALLRPALADEDASIAEGLRVSLAPYLTHKYTRGGNTLVVYLLDSAIEQAFANGTQDDRVRRAIHTEVGSLPPTSQVPAILTTAPIRAAVRAYLRPSHPELVVLSYQELDPAVNIQPIARISLDD